MPKDFKTRDPWIAIEEGVLQVHKKYQPKGPLLNSRTFPEKIKHYLDAGLWSAAEILLKNSKDPSTLLLQVDLHQRRGEYAEVYKIYQKNPFIFIWNPDFILGASQGALEQGVFHEALTLLSSPEASDQDPPKRLYLTSLAYWGLKDFKGLRASFEKSALWSTANTDSPWVGRLGLLRTYFHLNQMEYGLAFENLGTVFDDDTDLALLTLIWGYFKLDATGNLFSILQAFDENKEKSPYYIQTYSVLSRSLVGTGDLQGAIAMDQQIRDELRRRVTQLEEETELLKKRVVSSSISSPEGALLSKTLLIGLDEQYQEKREVKALLWYIGLKERQQVLSDLKERERTIEREQWALHMAMIRSCLSLRQTEAISPQIEHFHQEARKAADQGSILSVVNTIKRSLILESDGPYAEEGHFRLGDLAFGSEDYLEAIQHYSFILSFPESPLYRPALYKLAWSYYLDGKPEETVKLLVTQKGNRVLANDSADSCNFSQTPLENRESLRLLVLSLETLGGSEHLVRLIKERPAEESFPFVVALANHYESKKSLGDLFKLSFSWATAYPLYVETPFFHQRAMALIRPSDSFSITDVIEQRKRFVISYEPGSLWAAKNGAKRSEDLQPILKKHLQFLMKHYYAKGEKENRKSVFIKALPWYRLDLALFPSALRTDAMYPLYANLLDQLDKNRRAYYKRAYLDPPHRRSAEAGYQEIALLEQIYPVGDPLIREGHDRFVSHFPSDPRAKSLSMRLAELAFQGGDYIKSRNYASRVLGNTKVSGILEGVEIKANHLIVQGYLKEKAYPEMIVFLEELFSQTANDENLQEYKQILSFSYFQHGEGLKNRSQNLAAAEAYWKAYEYGSESDTGPLALYEAGVLWDTASTRKKAEDALQIFVVRYIHSTLYYPVMMRLGALYHETNRPIKGAEIYEKASRLPISPELSLRVLAHAMVLYEEAGNWEKVFLHAIKRAKQAQSTPSDGGPWIVKAAEMQFKLRETDQAKSLLINLIQDSKKAHPEKKRSERKTPEQDEEKTAYLAKAHFLLAESKISDFTAIKLTSPLDKNLEKKTRFFETLLKEYRYATVHPSPRVVLNANHRIGEIYEEFSRSLLHSERLPELTPEEAQMYDNLLKEQALSYIELAKEAYIENIELGKSMDIVNKWTKLSSKRLKRINQIIAFNIL